MSGASVRTVGVREADLEAVASLVNRAFARYAAIFPVDRTSAADYADEVGEDARVLLVEDGGRLLATAMVSVADRFLHSDGAPAGSRSAGTHPWIGASYFGLAGVEPQAMNRGLGRLLVGHAETMARADGFPRIALSTVREFGLVDYYARFGYEVVSEREHPAGHWDFVVPHHYCEMVKTL